MTIRCCSTSPSGATGTRTRWISPRPAARPGRSAPGACPAGRHQLHRGGLRTEREDRPRRSRGRGGGRLSLQVVDLRSISPLDLETLRAAALATGRVVVVHEATRYLGLGAGSPPRSPRSASTNSRRRCSGAGAYDMPYPPSRSSTSSCRTWIGAGRGRADARVPGNLRCRRHEPVPAAQQWPRSRSTRRGRRACWPPAGAGPPGARPVPVGTPALRCADADRPAPASSASKRVSE